jgi:uncharacterized membrane protein YjjP (DUF1212 family)
MTPAVIAPQPIRVSLTRKEGSNLILTFARVLYVNGESTQQTLNAAERVSSCLGFCVTVFPHWGDLEAQAEDSNGKFISAIEAAPSGVDMDRVASTMRAVEEMCNGRLTAASAMEVINRIAEAPPAPTWRFILASAVGAVALAVLFGVQHLTAASLIFGSAAVGALLRRTLARYSTNLFLQPFSAALIAGIVGALAVRCELSSPLRLVAVCPCMVLAPGPHFLNGMLDLIRGRMSLGASRLIYAVLVVVAISLGLLAGLALLGVSLPMGPAGRVVPLWCDVIAAGVAVGCFGVFSSSPLKMLPWPVAVGAVAHALRWVALTAFGVSAATGAFIACLVAGVILTPVSRYTRMPFAAIGFSSVVSMMPGVLMFRMASGLVQLTNSSQRTWELMGSTLADGSTAIFIIFAMSFGLLAPKLILDYVNEKTAVAKTRRVAADLSRNLGP